jgi:ketosteroid isomerase-like protein
MESRGLAAPDAEMLIREFVRAFLERSDELRFFLHEEAEMTLLVTEGETVRGRDALVRLLLGGDSSFEADALRFESLGDDAAIVEGSARIRRPDGTVESREAVWLHELRDGLIWRVRVYGDVDAARAAFRDRPA